MSDKKELYLDDSYLKEFDSKVVSVSDEKFVVLDQTAFYPNSGGQQNDTGKLIRKSDGKEFNVVFVGKFDGKVSHQVEPEGELSQNDEVRGVIDWNRRYKLMRSHTAAHLVSAVFHKEAGALITGNQLTIDNIRIDFNLEEFDKDKIVSYVEKCNKIIKQDLKIKVYYMPREEAEQNPSLFKLAKSLPPSLKELRIVEIGDYDRQADGGTHVNSLKEIGALKFQKAKNKGKNNRRVYFELVNNE